MYAFFVSIVWKAPAQRYEQIFFIYTKILIDYFYAAPAIAA